MIRKVSMSCGDKRQTPTTWDVLLVCGHRTSYVGQRVPRKLLCEACQDRLTKTWQVLVVDGSQEPSGPNSSTKR